MAEDVVGAAFGDVAEFAVLVVQTAGVEALVASVAEGYVAADYGGFGGDDVGDLQHELFAVDGGAGKVVAADVFADAARQQGFGGSCQGFALGRVDNSL